MTKVPMTVEGHLALDEELKILTSTERPQIIVAIAEAREHGDLKENAEYHSAKDKQGFIEARIKDLEAKLSRAQIIDVTIMSGDVVRFGATVTVFDEDTENEHTYKIVGEDEANVALGKISITSPIAKAMITKEIGDVVEVVAPGGSRSLEIVTVIWV
ncbi:Transcription elongation factor GreA [hydrothermal vent metagenome]|uniref:Transcription elongation factor GreA n=1 Tax=hydrothermal vent metagenome TaxID=652676 RepID=A0A3B0RRB8_9ZZZZ